MNTSKQKAGTKTATPQPATPDPRVEKALLEIEEIKKQLDAQRKAQDEREKALDAREVKMNTPSPAIAREVEARHKSKAEKMRENLHGQPKVTIMIPLAAGEVEGSTLSVTLNGYRYTIKKNVYVSVPKQVADVVMSSLKQTVAAGHDFRMDVERPAKNGITVEEALA